MNIYEKIQLIKKDFLEANVKKSGKNKFANYTYYELSDITPVLINLFDKYKIFTKFTYTKEEAILEIRNIEVPTEYEVYTSPIEELELKGCNKIQALGGVETYSRRYLYMSAFDIIENDMFDATTTDETFKEKGLLIAKFNNLVIETETDTDKIYQYYKVKTNVEMTIDQLKEAIAQMEKKKGE